MALTATAIRNTKPSDKPIKQGDLCPGYCVFAGCWARNLVMIGAQIGTAFGTSMKKWPLSSNGGKR